MITDVVFPLVEVFVYPQDISSLNALISAFSSESTASACMMLSSSKGTVRSVFTHVEVRVTLLETSNANTLQNNFVLEIDELRFFQGTLVPSQPVDIHTTGTFVLLNSKDLKLMDSDNAILLRKTPRQLRVRIFPSTSLICVDG